MNTVASRYKNNCLSLLTTVVISLWLVIGLQGCSSDNKSSPPDYSAANGLFSGSGTVNTDVALDDVRGFVHEGRFIFFDAAEAVLYDGNFTSIGETTLAATLNVYKDGEKITASNISVTGMLVNESSLILDLAGTGYAAGRLELTFDTELYGRGATMNRLATGPGSGADNRWLGDAHTPATTERGIVRLRSADDEAVFTLTGATGSPSQCQYNGTKSIPDAAINMYLINMDVTQFGSSCDHLGEGYTGFISVVDGHFTDDTILFAMTNGTNSNFSIMTLTPL